MSVRLLHIFSTFAAGGQQRRFVTVANATAGAFEHQVIAMDGVYEAAAGLEPKAAVSLLPAPSGKRSGLCAWRLRRTMRELAPDVVVTYNWGAIDGVLAARMAGIPAIHAEDGFGTDEAAGLKRRRVWTRRVLLRGAWRTVVPSLVLRRIALERYRLPAARVLYLPNGVDAARFRPSRNLALRRSHGVPDDAVLIGAVGRLGREKNLGLLLEAFARIASPAVRLALVGGGPCEDELRRRARELHIEDATIFAGHQPDPAPWYGALDLFAMSSATEQMPIALLEAMACGLPAACTAVGDIGHMLEGGPVQTVPAGDAAALAGALAHAASSAEWRAAAGAANRQRCLERHSLDAMIESYRSLYLAARRASAPSTGSESVPLAAPR